MSSAAKPNTGLRRALRDILLYGLCGGVLITLLKLTEYRFLVVEHSVELYGGLIAAIFASLGNLARIDADPTKGATLAAASRAFYARPAAHQRTRYYPT